MSGETEAQPSGWTIDSLHQHLSQIITEMDRRYQQRSDAQDLAVSAALTAAKEAVLKSETSMEKRFEGVNEFRATLSDQATTFMPRLEAEQRMSQIQDALASVNKRLDTTEGQATGGQEAKVALYAFAGFLVSLVVIGGFLAAAWPK